MTTTETLLESADPNREIRSSRHFAASPERLFEAFSDAAALAAWWGPKGFRNSFRLFDFRPDGAWDFVMNGPDGRDYPNESRFVAIEPGRRLTIDHLSAPRFRLFFSFEPEAGGTRLDMLMRFETDRIRDAIATYAVDANEENFDRLGAVIAGMEVTP